MNPVFKDREAARLLFNLPDIVFYSFVGDSSASYGASLDALMVRIVGEENIKNREVQASARGNYTAYRFEIFHDEFEDIGLRDAHVERGRGNATTWPNGQRWYPPIRIDQVFLRGQTVCLSINEGTGRGSDHRPMLFEVALSG